MEQNYQLIIESAKFIFLAVFLFGIFLGWFGREFDTFCTFICKLICKYMRLRRLKKRRRKAILNDCD